MRGLRARAVGAAAAVLVALGAAGCDRPTPNPQPQDPAVSVEPAAVSGVRLLLPGREPATLAAPASAVPNGWLSPVAVPSPDRRLMAYRTWFERPDGGGRPALRLRDLGSGTDTMFADGAASLAWARDGRIAYALGGDERPGAGWTARVMVRASLGAGAVAWTTPSRHYVVAAWAGPHLLVYQVDGRGRTILSALDGPDRSRTLGPGVLVAVDPAGERAFLAVGPDEGPAKVRVVRVATGETLAEFALAGTGIDAVGHAGDWSGDLVVAAGYPMPAVFRVSPLAITLERLLTLDPQAFPYGVREPGFVAGGAVAAWAATDVSEDPPTAAVRCRLDGGGCVAGPTFPPPGAHPLRNPSRP